jgi:hypothetical protein
MQNLILMHKDTVIGTCIDGKLEPVLPDRLPLFVARTGDVQAWLESRAIDRHRTNSRLLKRALRLDSTDDLIAVLFVNGATITDNFWVKPIDDVKTTYADVRFTFNHFDKLALMRDGDSFDLPPSRTPELTNTGSFEKCWRLIDGAWWMVKDGKPKEQFSELLVYELGKKLGFSMTQYLPDGEFIRSRDFTENAKVDFEPAFSIISDVSDYIKVYDALVPYGEAVCSDYVKMCYLDALTRNVDRHGYNCGLLRDSDTGEVLRFAPFFDHNLALVATGYPRNIEAKNDRLITDFADLLRHTGKPLSVPKLSRAQMVECTRKVPWRLPKTDEVKKPKTFVVEYLQNRQVRTKELSQELLIQTVQQTRTRDHGAR